MAIGGGKRKKRGVKGKPDNPAQSARFIKAAKELGVDETGKSFHQTMQLLAAKKPKVGN